MGGFYLVVELNQGGLPIPEDQRWNPRSPRWNVPSTSRSRILSSPPPMPSSPAKTHEPDHCQKILPLKGRKTSLCERSPFSSLWSFFYELYIRLFYYDSMYNDYFFTDYTFFDSRSMGFIDWPFWACWCTFIQVTSPRPPSTTSMSPQPRVTSTATPTQLLVPLCSPGLGTIAYPLLAISKYVAGLQLNLTMATPSHRPLTASLLECPVFLDPEMNKPLESSKSSSLNLQALGSMLGLVQNKIQVWSSKSGSELYDIKHLNLSFGLQNVQNKSSTFLKFC